MHTGHLQVPLSQFSCRYDSKSKHCRSRETKTDEPRALRNHLYATGTASGTLMKMSHQGGRQVMERPGAGGLGGVIIFPISCCAYSLWATLSPCNNVPSPPHTSPVHQITHGLQAAFQFPCGRPSPILPLSLAEPTSGGHAPSGSSACMRQIKEPDVPCPRFPREGAVDGGGPTMKPLGPVVRGWGLRVWLAWPQGIPHPMHLTH